MDCTWLLISGAAWRLLTTRKLYHCLPAGLPACLVACLEGDCASGFACAGLCIGGVGHDRTQCGGMERAGNIAACARKLGRSQHNRCPADKLSILYGAPANTCGSTT